MAHLDAALRYIYGGEIAERSLRQVPHLQVMARFFASPADYVAKALEDLP